MSDDRRASPLIETKLHVPSPRRNLVTRPRLQASMAGATDAKLVLVSAPAGFGKTTFVAAWLRTVAANGAAVAWVSLDERDDDPASFWSYVLAALDAGVTMNTSASRPKRLPPPWFIHLAWRVHRALYRLSGGRFLWTTEHKRGWGAMRLTAIGRKSGQERSVILGYLEDGPNLVTLAMNGWDEGSPAWWLNLAANPDAVVRLAREQPRAVRARRAVGDERDRLWRCWAETDPDLDVYSARRSTETPVVVLEPRAAAADIASPPWR